MRLIDADAFWKHFEEGKVKLLLIKSMLPLEMIDATLKIYAEIKEMIDSMPTIDPEPQWIPCSDRLPEEDKEVLVTVYFHGLKQTHPTGWNDHIKPSYYVETASQIGGNWSSVSDEYKIAKNRHEVIAWMPLPSAYKGE